MTTYTVQYKRPTDVGWQHWSSYSHCTMALALRVCDRIERVDGYVTRLLVDYEVS